MSCSYTIDKAAWGAWLFFVVWISGWTIGTAGIALGYSHGENGEPLGSTTFWMLVFIDVAVALIASYVLFNRRVIRVTKMALTLEIYWLGIHKRHVFPASEICLFRQWQDGGKDEDSFVTWALEVQGSSKRNLVFRQAYDSSFWLGKLLAVYYETNFLAEGQPTPPRERLPRVERRWPLK